MATNNKGSNSQALVANIDKNLEIFERSHKESHESLAILSRDLLIYVCGYGDVEPSGDIGRVNRILAAMDPADRKRSGSHARDIAMAFFVDMLDYKFDPKTRRFAGGKITSVSTQAKLKVRRTTFLRNPNNNIWTWAEKELAPVQRAPMNYVSRLSTTLENALDKDKNERWFKGYKEGDKVIEPARDKAALEEMIVTEVVKALGINRFMDIADAKRQAYTEAKEKVTGEKPATETPAPAEEGKRSPVKV
jgi:hypothetical protein